MTPMVPVQSPTRRESALLDLSMVGSTLQQVLKAIALVGAAVAGLAAILGTFGFLSYTTADNRLGVDVGLRVPLEYISEGGLFVAHTGYNALARNALTAPLTVPPGASYTLHWTAYVAVAVALLCFLAIFVSYRLRSRHRTLVLWLRRIAGILILAVELLTVYRLEEPVGWGRFLVSGIPDSPMFRALITGRDLDLDIYYGTAAACFLITSVTLLYWLAKARQESASRFLAGIRGIGLFGLVAMLWGLPLASGALKPTLFPVVHDFRFKDGQGRVGDQKSQFFLILQREKLVVLYDRMTYRVYYLRGDVVEWLVVGQEQNVLAGRRVSTDAAREDLKLLRAGLEAYRRDNGTYPSNELGLRALVVSSPERPSGPNWRGPYVPREQLALDPPTGTPVDPWSRPYFYKLRARQGRPGYELRSMGRDGRTGKRWARDDILPVSN